MVFSGIGAGINELTALAVTSELVLSLCTLGTTDRLPLKLAMDRIVVRLVGLHWSCVDCDILPPTSSR
jgi:hypothetical protein